MSARRGASASGPPPLMSLLPSLLLLLLMLLLMLAEVQPLPQPLEQPLEQPLGQPPGQQLGLHRQRRHVIPHVHHQNGTTSSSSSSSSSTCSLRQLCPAQHCLHGICIDAGEGGECFCEDGYTGVYCETDADDCLSSPCHHGGTCSDRTGGYTCDCAPGYTGDRCERLVRGCREARCANGASCVYAHHGLVACLCPPGFRGARCETDISVCRHVQPPHVRCHHGGRCLDGPANTYRCQCPPGYTGATCLIDVDECASSPCQNGGSCVDQVNDFQCVCQAGFSGRLCQTILHDCQVNVCENGGLCVRAPTGETCLCRPDFHGERCQRQYDDCQPEPRCLHGGTCVDEVNSYRCECPPGASGQHCQCLTSAENGTYCVAPEHSVPRVAGLQPHLVITVGYSTVFHTSVVATEYVDATASVVFDGTTAATTEDGIGETTVSDILPSFETVEPGGWTASSTPWPTFSPSADDELTTAVTTTPTSSEVDWDWDVLSSPRDPEDIPRTSPVSVEDTPLQTVPKSPIASPTLPLPGTASPSIVITSPVVVPSSPGATEVIPTSVRPSEVTPVLPRPSPVVSSELYSTSLVIPPEEQVRTSTESPSTTTDVDNVTATEQGYEFSTQGVDTVTPTDELATQTEVVSTQTGPSTETEEVYTQTQVSTETDYLYTDATNLSSTTEEIQTTHSTESPTQETSTQVTDSSTQTSALSTQPDDVSTPELTASTELPTTPYISGIFNYTDESTTVSVETITELAMTSTELNTQGSTAQSEVSTDGDLSTTLDFTAEELSTTSTTVDLWTEADNITKTAFTSTDFVTQETTFESGTSDRPTTSEATTSDIPLGTTDVPTEQSFIASDLTTEYTPSTLDVSTEPFVTDNVSTTVTTAPSTEPVSATTDSEQVSTESSTFVSQVTPDTTSVTSDSDTSLTSTETSVSTSETSTFHYFTTEGTSEPPDEDTSSSADPYMSTDLPSVSSTTDVLTTEDMASTTSTSAETISFASSTGEPSSTEPEPAYTSTTVTQIPTTSYTEQDTTNTASSLPDIATTEAASPSQTTSTAEVTSPSPDIQTTEVAPPSADTATTDVAPPTAEGVTSDLLPIRFFPDTYLLLESNGIDQSLEDPEEYKDTDLLEEVLADEGQFLEDDATTELPPLDGQKEEAPESTEPEQEKQEEEGGANNYFTEDAKRVRLKISFATLSEDGVVLSSLPAGVPPWYRLFLSGGLLRLAFACSGRQATSFIETQAKVNTGRRITVHFVLRWVPAPGRPSRQAGGSCRAAMRVAGSPVTVAQQFADRPLDRRVALVVGSPPREPGFSGYLLELQVNGQRFDDLSLIVADSVGEWRSPCDEAGCRHNSTCQQITWMEVRCLCPPGFSGARCELAPCDPSPCGPGGRCALLSSGAAVCLCPFGKTGPYCQTETAFPGSRYQFHGSAGGLPSHLTLNVNGSLRHQFWMFFHLATNETEQTSLLALLTDSVPQRADKSEERSNTTIVLGEFPSARPAPELDSAVLAAHTDTMEDAETGSKRPWNDAPGDFFAVTVSRGYVTVTWQLGSGSRRLMSEAPLDPEMTVQTVRVGRRAQRVWLQVNAQRVVTARAPGDYTMLDVINELHIGGYGDTGPSPELPADLGSYRGFSGCVFDLRLGLGSYRGVPLTVVRGQNVTPCHLDHCQRPSRSCSSARDKRQANVPRDRVTRQAP